MASRSLNKVILIGNLTRDTELKYTPTGTAVCTFGVATNRSWTTNEGQTKEDVQFHRIVAWQKLAELCGKLLNKGRKVYLEGRLVYRTFVGRDGQQRTIAEIVLDDFIVFGDGRRVSSTDEGGKPEAKTTETLVSTDEPVSPVNDTASDIKTTEKSTDKKAQETKEDINPDDIPF